MKHFNLLIFLLFISCSAIKIKENDIEENQPLIGKIKQIEISTFRYSMNNKDSYVRNENSIMFYDKKNKIIKQIDYYPKFTDEIIFNYSNNLLQNATSKINGKIRKTEYKYDDRKNVTEYCQLTNDSLFFKKTSIYDDRNNIIEQKLFWPKYKKNNSIEKFSYDYKKRTVIIQTYDEKHKMTNHYLKNYFNKKGYIIKTQIINQDLKDENTITSTTEYDKRGNIIKKINFDNNEKPKEITEFKYSFDKKGNIILQEIYQNEKLVKKIEFKITYQ